MKVGLVLAGGDSRRFGSNKALHPVADRPLIFHVIDALRPQCDQLLIAGGDRAEAYGDFGVPVLRDIPKGGLGPLGGILAGLVWMQQNASDACLITSPCDTPVLPRNFAAELMRDEQPHFAEADGRWHFAHASWRSNALAPVSQAVSTDQLALKKIHKHLGSEPVSFPLTDPRLFLNVNRPEDAERFVATDQTSRTELD